MSWTVIYRNEQGEKAQCVIDVNSREALFSELNKRGISAISVAEGVGVAKSCATSVRTAIFRALILSVIVAIVVGVVVWFFSSNAEKDIVEKRPLNFRKPKEITPPQIRPIGVDPVVETPKPYWDIDESETNKLSEMQLKKWRNVRRPRTIPYTRERPKARYEIFEHRSENMIASLLDAKPGQGFIGTPNYKDIEKDFLESCTKPIIVSKDDDEYSSDLKRQMIEVKIDIKNRMDSGEKLQDIIQSSREEMQKLAAYRRFLAEEVRKAELSDESADSINDILEAANRMLSEKGIAPLKQNPIIESHLRRFKQKGTIE